MPHKKTSILDSDHKCLCVHIWEKIIWKDRLIIKAPGLLCKHNVTYMIDGNLRALYWALKKHNSNP